jgi:hypothetical protein
VRRWVVHELFGLRLRHLGGEAAEGAEVANPTDALGLAANRFVVAATFFFGTALSLNTTILVARDRVLCTFVVVARATSLRRRLWGLVAQVLLAAGPAAPR